MKHVVDVATAAAAAAIAVVPIVVAVDNPISNNIADVHIGSTVHAFFLRVEVIAASGFVTVPRVYMGVQKNPGNEHPSANPSSIGDSDLKKFIIHQEMVMVSGITDTQIPRTMFQGVIRIPPRLRRFGVNDRLILTFAHQATETTGITSVCIQAIYKEFY